MNRATLGRAKHRGRKLASSALTLRQRVDAAIEPTALRLGWLGLAALVACGLLYLLPRSLWPAGVPRHLLPVWTMVALTCASFIGWGAMRHGQTRLRRYFHPKLARILFLVAPFVCAVLLLVHKHITVLWPILPRGHGSWTVLRWYIPVLVASSLLAYVLWRSRPGRRIRLREASWAFVIVTPYALLCAALVFGFHVPGVDSGLHRAVALLGEWSILLQIALGWFVGGRTS